MLSDAQRQATEITDTAKAQAQQIADQSTIDKAKSESAVAEEAKAAREAIQKQQDDASRQVNQLLEQLAQQRDQVENETNKLLEEARNTRAQADEYADQKRAEADEALKSALEDADKKASELISERRDAAQKEISGLQEQISSLQEREAAITSRVDELRSIFSQAFGQFGPFAQPEGEGTKGSGADGEKAGSGK